MLGLCANVNSTVIPAHAESRNVMRGKYFYIITAQLDSRLRGNDAQILHMSQVLLFRISCFYGRSLAGIDDVFDGKA